MSDISFTLNYTNLYLINTTPGGPSKTWERIGAGINSVEWEGNEEVSQDAYYDGEGLASSDVTGGQMVGTFEGHRKYGDPAQDFIASLMLDYSGRKTDFRWIAPDGQTLEGEVTVANIKPQGGDPNAKSDFGFEVHFNGMPQYTAGDANEFPESVTCSAVTVKVGASIAAGATVSPSGSSPALVYGVEDDSIATVDADGNVTGVKAGKTKLSVKSAVKPLVNVSCDVTVSAAS